MKVGILSLMLAAAGIVLPVAAQAVAEHYQLDIPRQQLDAALKDLAQQTGLQIARFSDTPGGSAFVGPVKGDMPVADALKTLLAPSKLTYQIVNDHTIAVMTLSAAAAAQTQLPTPPGSSQSVGAAGDPNQQEGKKSFWDNFRLAQANQGAAQRSSTVGSDVQSSSATSGNSPQLTEILVTAQKRSERLQDVPVPVSVIDTKALADNNQVLLKDYYTAVPGLVVTPGIVSSINLTIRGISDGNTITVDDVPFAGSTPYTAAGYLPDLDPGDLARIEVLRGPQGTLYGANSMGGLVKFVTVDPTTDSYSGRVEAGTSAVYNGAERGYNLRASVNVPITESVAIRASAFTRQDPGYIDNPVYEIKGVNMGRADGGRLSALWRPSEDFSLKVSALYQDYKANGASESDVAPSLGPLEQNYLPGLGGFHRTIQADSAIVNYRVAGIDLTSVTGYNEVRTAASLDFGFAFGPLVQAQYGPTITGAAYYQTNATYRFSQELRASIPLGPRLQWQIGGFYSREDAPLALDVDGVDPATLQKFGHYWVFFRPGSVQDQYAAFTDLTYKITDRLDVQIGGRETFLKLKVKEGIETGPLVGNVTVVDPGSSSKNNTFTYLLTPRFVISPDLMVYGRFASGFNPGGPSGAPPGSPQQYKSEKTNDYELGLKGSFIDHLLSVDASIFYIDYSDIALTLFTGPQNSIFYLGNGGKAKSEGVDLSVTAVPSTGLSIAASVDYDHAVLSEAFPASSTVQGLPGDLLPLAARFSGHLAITQDFPLPAGVIGFVGGEVGYVGDRTGVFQPTGQPRQVFPGYTKTDVHAGVRFDSWKINAYVNNVTDRRGVYGGGVGYDPQNAFLYITPRTVGVSVIKSF